MVLLVGSICALLITQSTFTAAQEPSASAPPITSAAASTSAEPTSPAHETGAADAPAGETQHSPVGQLLLALVLILLLAKIFGDIFERLGMPAVLGELAVGILLGNLGWLFGWHQLNFLHAPDPHDLTNPYTTGAMLKVLAEIGVILLLFEVGLESTVAGMMKVGASSLVVALLGVVAPMLLGLLVGKMLLADEPWQIWLFLGATLSATSVGITARVLKDLGRSQQRESQIILGAAVIDDVLGLLVLAVVVGIIQKGADFDAKSLLTLLASSIGFLLGAVLIGGRIVKPLFKAANFLKGHNLLVVTSLVICFTFAYLAGLAGLAPIVGAFAAGLILEHAHYHDVALRENVELEAALKPLTSVLVPIFFVQMGIMVDLSSFTNPEVWLLAGALTVAAVIGKQICSLGVLEKGLDRLSVGLGMIPRGEVGLIFASVGAGLMVGGEKVISDETYSAIVVMVLLTTLVTPPLLKWSMSRRPASPPVA
ncbi:cation:proton antiporter [Planctomicrobium sp. SH664]|uniref:cation:proton antiporter n=1 Tax=Planctomicrobium sp. SH664 TaxID=3448125 RepID=UPI003F5B2E7F